MRFPLLAGLAVLGAATDFDDDDLNFLRQLSSNSSGNSSATTTMAPANTTTMAPNTTTMAATTTAAAGNTTTAAPTTTAASGGGNATTTMAATTTAGGSSETTTAAAATTTAAGSSATALCAAATYTMVGLTAPATIGTAGTNTFMLSCSVSMTSATPSLPIGMTNYGDGTDANKARCTDNSGTLTEVKCNGDNALSMFNSFSTQQKRAMVQYCCGRDTTYNMASEVSMAGTPTTGASIMRGLYTDSSCATAKTLDATASAIEYQYVAMNGGTTNPKTFAMDTCHNVGYLGYMKASACNSTTPTTAGVYIQEVYIDAACTQGVMVGLASLKNCVMHGASTRMLGAHNGTSTTLYEKALCEGGSAPANLEFNTASTATFSSLPVMTSAQVTSFGNVVKNTVVAETTTAAGSSGTVSVVSSRGSGDLSSYSGSRRRLAERRLGAHSGTGAIDTVLKVTVPTAKASAVKADVDTAVASGVLQPATLASKITTQLSSDSSTSSFAANITATVAIATTNLVVPAPSGGGSTSGAFAQYSSALVGLLFAAVALLM